MSTPSSPADRGARSANGASPEQRTERVSIMGRASRPEEGLTQALPQGWAEEPTDPGAEQWNQPATSVLPTAMTPQAPGPQTSVLPTAGPAQGGWGAQAPGYEVPVVPTPQARPEPGPAPRAPRPRRDRRRSAALPIGTLLLIVSVLLLGWGVYTLLVSIDVFEIVVNGEQVVDLAAVGAIAGGGVLAFLAFIAAIRAVVRCRPRFAACLLLVGTFLLPTAAVLGAGYYGGTVLKDRTLAQADQYAGQIDAAQVQQVEDVLDQVEAMGVPVPWRDDLLDLLGTVSSGQ